MTQPHDPSPPRLAPPGAGIPFFQRMVLRYVFFPKYSKKMTWEGSQEFFRKEGLKLLKLAIEAPPERINRPALVKPMVGLEDSSRYWSIAMVMEHLMIVGKAIADGVLLLTHGRTPQTKVDTAKVKPFENLPANVVIPQFQTFLEDFLRRTSGDIGDRGAEARHLHPWFGLLNARQWMALAALHQRLHRKQAEAIRRETL